MWPFSEKPVVFIKDKAVVIFSKSEKLARLEVMIEPWGMPFEVAAGEDLRCTLECNDAFWEVVVEGEFVSAHANGHGGTMQVHKRSGDGEWQLVMDA